MKVTFSKSAYEDNAFDNHVGDEYIKDFYEDTWVATDSYGRKVADFEEVGGVKAGDHKVCMFYWDWHIGSTSVPKIISEVVKKNPEAKDGGMNHHSTIRISLTKVVVRKLLRGHWPNLTLKSLKVER